MSTNVVMPQLGESVVEGTIGKWLKNVGDTIAQYEPIMEVITDKVTTEIPSPAAGTLVQILVPEGATVQAGTVVGVIGQAEAVDRAPAPPQNAPSAAQVQTSHAAAAAPSGAAPANASARNRLTPVVARMISEYNISAAELETIQGTGENGRVSKKDIENFLKRRAPQTAAPAAAPLPAWEQPGSGDLFRPTDQVFSKPPAPAAPQPQPPAAPPTGGDQIIPLSPMRRSIAEHMVRSKATAPHVTTVSEADMSRVLAHFAAHKADFEKQGVKLTYTPYFVQAVVYGLQQTPLVNAQFTEQGIIMKRELNIGIAVAIPDGLIVPVIKHADDKSLLGLARAVNDVASRAREKKLQPDELTGATFTLTNHGVFGSLFGTPIISQPQSAIMGMGAIQKRAVVINDAIAIRPMMYLSLSFDHRLLDGAMGDLFMNKVIHYLENYPAA